MDNYFNSCNKRRLNQNFSDYFNNINETPNLYGFCDFVLTSYYEYAYNNDINNYIRKCGSEKSLKLYDFCFEWYKYF